MKHLLIIISLLYSLFALGQNNYEVFNFTNKVHIKHHGTTDWLPAKKGLSLGFLDSIYIGNQSEIRIVDLRSNEVYLSTQMGYFRVKNIRDAAKEQSTNMLSAMQAQILKNNQHSLAMNMVGATTRGNNNDHAEAIANSIVWIGKNIQHGSQQFDTAVHLIAHKTDETLTFTLKNNSSTDYCINVVLYDFQKQKASLCYVISPTMTDYPYVFLPNHQSINLTAWHFIPPTPSKQYILVATVHCYDSEQLQQILTYLDWDDVTELDYKNIIVAPIL